MTALAVVTPAATQLPAADAAAKFDLMQRKARLFASSPLIPEHLRKGGPEQAMANCYIGLTMAEAMNENPLIILQNLNMISGKAGFASQYMIARANASGMFKGTIGWRVDRTDKQNLSVTAFALLKETGEEVSFTVDMAMARAEGWTKNAKYQTMPEVMLRYRSAAFLVRFYAPHVMLGYTTVEELEDMRFASAKPVEDSPRLTGAALLAQAAGDDSDGTITDLALPTAGPTTSRAPTAESLPAGDGGTLPPQGARVGAAPSSDLPKQAADFVAGVLKDIEDAEDGQMLELAMLHEDTRSGLIRLEREFPDEWRRVQAILDEKRAAFARSARVAYGNQGGAQ